MESPCECDIELPDTISHEISLLLLLLLLLLRGIWLRIRIIGEIHVIYCIELSIHILPDIAESWLFRAEYRRLEGKLQQVVNGFWILGI